MGRVGYSVPRDQRGGTYDVQLRRMWSYSANGHHDPPDAFLVVRGRDLQARAIIGVDGREYLDCKVHVAVYVPGGGEIPTALIGMWGSDFYRLKDESKLHQLDFAFPDITGGPHAVRLSKR